MVFKEVDVTSYCYVLGFQLLSEENSAILKQFNNWTTVIVRHGSYLQL